ncbi:tRNA1(Val) (adenine(37)-N6)-methyltransferase [Chitinophaga sp. GCM10012297]|uniref:tRNA1(Val) (adenine(37)-N6)-methyltransferase n=1 Tax=Chitinophaga chungangae TaxID=2821488 RepID=A0ABS3YHJ7_9BACT|nr:methyltransferase [Chitinophaga chungangae]MBO9154114.1 methyltransferase [Chitinophaga chungangae]
MGNSYFRFKQFTVEQAGSAMKVCTDACIQGAFTAAFVKNETRVLDIGTGTGLLSLMLAQQSPAAIDALELDEAAYRQALSNFEASPWHRRLRAIHADVQSYRPEMLYPFIITNPPFFENDLKSPDSRRNAAMHTTTLDYAALMNAIRRLLSPGGRFSVLLPWEGFQRFCGMAEAVGFTLQELLEVRQTPSHGFFRAAGIFGEGGERRVRQMSVYDAEKQYTPEFTALLKDYYLYL